MSPESLDKVAAKVDALNENLTMMIKKFEKLEDRNFKMAKEVTVLQTKMIMLAALAAVIPWAITTLMKLANNP